MDVPLSLTLYDFNLGAYLGDVKPVKAETANALFTFFKNHHLFNWTKSHNYCESRAEAVSLMLQAANIEHAKAWVFGAAFLHRGYVGGLKNNWNFHVAIALPVMTEYGVIWMVLDPSLNKELVVLEYWAESITAYPHSYYFLKEPDYYIFPDVNPNLNTWHKRKQRNFKWTMQGLMGIHAMDAAGKAKLVFRKKMIVEFTKEFFLEMRKMKAETNAS
jgi:hypothetical protein